MSTESSGTAQTAADTAPTGQAPGSEPKAQDVAAPSEHGPRTAAVNLPFMKAQFRAPEMHLPQLQAPHVGRAELSAAAHTARSLLPPPRQALYYAGLAVLAAVEVIEWPVAAAIGVGTAVMSRGGGEQRRQEAARTEPAAAAGTPTKEAKGAAPEPAPEEGAGTSTSTAPAEETAATSSPCGTQAQAERESGESAGPTSQQ